MWKLFFFLKIIMNFRYFFKNHLLQCFTLLLPIIQLMDFKRFHFFLFNFIFLIILTIFVCYLLWAPPGYLRKYLGYAQQPGSITSDTDKSTPRLETGIRPNSGLVYIISLWGNFPLRSSCTLLCKCMYMCVCVCALWVWCFPFCLLCFWLMHFPIYKRPRAKYIFSAWWSAWHMW